MAQLKIQLSQILDSGYEILDFIERYQSDFDENAKNTLIKCLFNQSMRIRTFNALILDPDTKDMLEVLDPRLRKRIQRVMSEKKLHIYSDLDNFSRPIYQEQLSELYNPKRLKEIKGRFKQLEDALGELSAILKENLDFADLV